MKTLHRPPKSIYKRITIISAVYLHPSLPPPLPSSSLHYEFRVMPAAGRWWTMKRKFEPQCGDSGRSIVSRVVLQRPASNCARFHFNDPDYVSFGPITSIGYFERYVDHQPVLEHREEFGGGKRGMRSISWTTNCKFVDENGSFYYSCGIVR